MAAPRSIETPMTRVFGLADFTARATPAARPPPESGTRTAARSGRSSISSRPAVPWPAMTCGSSKGGISARPSVSARRRESAAASSWERPAMRTSAPRARIAATLAAGTRADMQTTARRLRARAAKATARPWLPVEQQVTPGVSGGQAGDGVEGAAELEGADRLGGLELEQEVGAEGGGDEAACGRRRRRWCGGRRGCRRGRGGGSQRHRDHGGAVAGLDEAGEVAGGEEAGEAGAELDGREAGAGRRVDAGDDVAGGDGGAEVERGARGGRRPRRR